MSPHQLQSVAKISTEQAINIVTLYNWRKDWLKQREVVPAFEREPEGWSAADKSTVVLGSATLKVTELIAYAESMSCTCNM